MTALRAPMLRHRAPDPQMSLPNGKTCNDCAHCNRCCAIFGHIPADEVCDFYPSRFHERKRQAREQDQQTAQAAGEKA